MNKSHFWLFALLALLWIFLGSFFHNNYCNCGGAAVALPSVIAPGATGAGKSIIIADAENSFRSGTGDNLLFPLSKCDYSAPLSPELTKVFQETADHLKNNAQRILTLTGLYRSTEQNECAAAKDLGFGRAEKVKQLLIGMGAPENQIRLLSAQNETDLYEGQVLGGVRYEFISGEVGEVEKRLRIGNMTLYFDTNARQINLTAEQQQYFDDLKSYLVQKPDAAISVEGHTDNRSSLTYNLRLSKHRAEFVRDFMVQNGIPAKNIMTGGQGPKTPLDTNYTEEGRAKNRRVEVKIQ